MVGGWFYALCSNRRVNGEREACRVSGADNMSTEYNRRTH